MKYLTVVYDFFETFLKAYRAWTSPHPMILKLKANYASKKCNKIRGNVYLIIPDQWNNSANKNDKYAIPSRAKGSTTKFFNFQDYQIC